MMQTSEKSAITKTLYTIVMPILLIIFALLIMYSSVKQSYGFIDIIDQANDRVLQLERDITQIRTAEALTQINNSLTADPITARFYLDMAIRNLNSLIDNLNMVRGTSPSDAIDEVILALEVAKTELEHNNPDAAKDTLEKLNGQLIAIER
jgi:hypothetical protein